MKYVCRHKLKRLLEYVLIRGLAFFGRFFSTTSPPTPQTILAFESFGVGDVVCALPAVRALRFEYPVAEIIFVTSRTALQFCEGLPFIGRCEICPRSFAEVWRFVRREGAARRGTLAVLLNDGWWQNLCVHLLRPRWACGYLHRPDLDTRFHPTRLSRATWDASRQKTVAPDTHLVRRGMSAAAPALTASTAELSDPPRIPELGELQNGALPDKLLAQLLPAKALVICHPGARNKTRQWPTERWREFLDAAAKDGRLQILLTGIGSDIQLCDDLARDFPDAQVLSVAGQLNLAQEAALLGRAKCFVGPDCGLAHLASAVGCPAVVLMGPTHPATSSPFWEPKSILFHPHEELLTVGGAMQGNEVHPAMLKIGVDEVWQAVVHQCVTNDKLESS